MPNFLKVYHIFKAIIFTFLKTLRLTLPTDGWGPLCFLGLVLTFLELFGLLRALVFILSNNMRKEQRRPVFYKEVHV